MFRKSASLLLATVIWLGFSVEPLPEGGFDVSFSHADAKKDKGKSKGNNGGGKSKGNSGSSKGKSDSKGNSGGNKGNSGGNKGNSGGNKGNSGGNKGNRGGNKGNSGSSKGKSDSKGNSGGNKGNSGNNNAGGQGFGWSQVNQNARMARKEVSKEAMVKNHSAVEDLKDLISLNRNINGLLNTRSPSVSEFRDLFFEDSGKPKKFAKDAELDELVDEYDLLMMLDRHYGYEVNEYVYRDVRFLLRQRFEEYKALQ